MRRQSAALCIVLLTYLLGLSNSLIAQCQVARIVAPDGDQGDRFGWAVAAAGDFLIASSPFHNEGAVYVFRRSRGSWLYEMTLLHPNPSPFCSFGAAVAMQDDLVVVGVDGDDQIALNAGSALVFRRHESSFEFEQALFASDGQAGDLFGTSVAIADDVIVIGAIGDDDVATGAGAAYVFQRSDAGWEEKQKLTGSFSTNWDSFGDEVSVDGSWIAVSATSDNAGGSIGSVYLFNRSTSDWEEVQTLNMRSPNEFSVFGSSIILHHNELLVGSPAVGNGKFVGEPGQVYTYMNNGVEWSPGETQLQVNFGPHDEDGFGVSLATQSDRLVVGAHYESNGGDAFSGALYVFRRSATGWSGAVRLNHADANDGDLLGEAVALSGDFAFASITGADDACSNPVLCNSGAVAIFRVALTTDADLGDFSRLQNCFTTAERLTECCRLYDFDFDNNVNVADYAQLYPLLNP